MKKSTPILYLFTFLFSQPEPNHEFYPGWSWHTSSSAGFVFIQDVTLFGQAPDPGMDNGLFGFCPDGDVCDIAAAFYNGECVGAAYFFDNQFLIPINFNDFFTDGVENYPMAGGTVNLKIFDANTETVYHSIFDSQVFPLSQALVSGLNISSDGPNASEPYTCPEAGSPYFDPYAGGGDLELCGKGDVNLDEFINVLDVIITANFIIGIQPPLPYLEYLADMNRDGGINVLDVMEIVLIILGQ